MGWVTFPASRIVDTMGSGITIAAKHFQGESVARGASPVAQQVQDGEVQDGEEAQSLWAV